MSFSGEIYGFMGYWNQLRGRDAKAFVYYTRADEAGFETVNYRMAYCTLLMQKGQFEKAEGILSSVLSYGYHKKPESKQICRLNLAICYEFTDRIDDAVELCEQVYKKMKSARTYQLMGDLYIKAGMLDKAEACIKEALDYDDNDAVILDNAGCLAQAKGDLEGAERYFKEALAHSPGQACTLYSLACLEMGSGRPQAAMKHLKTAAGRNIRATSGVTRDELEAAINTVEGMLESGKYADEVPAEEAPQPQSATEKLYAMREERERQRDSAEL